MEAELIVYFVSYVAVMLMILGAGFWLDRRKKQPKPKYPRAIKYGVLSFTKWPDHYIVAEFRDDRRQNVARGKT